MRERLVVVGGDAAGMSAASQAKRLAPDLEILAFERGDYVSYAACGEPYVVGGEVSRVDDLVARTPAEFAARGIAVQLRSEVLEIDLDRRTILVDSSGDRSRLGFDYLMYSTGARPLRPPSVVGAEKAWGLRTLNDAENLRRLVDRDLKKAVVVGGGYIGLEAAEAFAHRGRNVTLVTSGEHVLTRTLDPDMGALADDALRRLGIEVVTGVYIDAIDEHMASGGGLDFFGDVILIGLGTSPDSELARGAGIGIGITGAVAVNPQQETDQPGIWSGGDCAESTHRVSGRQIHLALGTAANKQGRIAGTNIGHAAAGQTERVTFPGVLGTAITKVGEIEIARTGLLTAECVLYGFEPAVGSVTGTNTASYWPTAARTDLKVIADHVSRRVLGAQIVGGAGSGKKIDAIATAIWAEMSIDELAWVDLAYAPPFSGVWDLIHIAARRAAS
ncbi:MAG TPA: FAD-dependent oxidoreductase [Acidimicrobiia bacterium]|nr:FAD-dependent oxidoreductase [Acidimicrobiia bacterium]